MGRLSSARQRAGAARVVDVRVREPQRLEREPAFFNRLQQLADVAARVDQGGFVGFIAPDEGAVLFEGGDGEGEAVEHAVDQVAQRRRKRTIARASEAAQTPSGRGPLAEPLQQRRIQLGPIDGLGDVVEHAGLQASLLVFLESVGGHGEDRRVLIGPRQRGWPAWRPGR